MTKGFRQMSVCVFVLSIINFINCFKEMILYGVLHNLEYVKNPEVAASLGWGDGWVLFVISSALLLFSFAVVLQSLKLEAIDESDFIDAEEE